MNNYLIEKNYSNGREHKEVWAGLGFGGGAGCGGGLVGGPESLREDKFVGEDGGDQGTIERR